MKEQQRWLRCTWSSPDPAGRLEPRPAERARPGSVFQNFRAFPRFVRSVCGVESELYQRRFLRPRRHFSAFFELYIFSFAPFQISLIFQDLCTMFGKIRCNSCWFSEETADFVIFRQIFADFVRNFAEFQWFRKEWCQDSHISEKSEKICWNVAKFWCKIAGNLSEKNGSSKSPRR